MDDVRGAAPPPESGPYAPPPPAASAAAAVDRRGALPPVPTYVRLVIALGLGSIRAALPAIAFLYFYRLGMDIFLEYAQDSSMTYGTMGTQPMAARALMEAAAYLPLLVLIYTPFLPLLDSLLRGERAGFFDSVKHVLEVFARFLVSILAQAVVLMGPPLLLILAFAMILAPMPSLPEEIRALVALGIIVPSGLWGAAVGLLFVFATPLVILDGGHPLGALGRSASLVRRHLGPVLGRLIVIGLLLVLAGVFLSLPEAFIQAAAKASGIEHPALRLARVIWSSAVSAFLFPFSVAALMVLYRGVVPASSRGETGPRDAPAVSAVDAAPPTTPFIFE